MKCKSKNEYIDLVKATSEHLAVFKTRQDIIEWLRPRINTTNSYSELGREIIDEISVKTHNILEGFLDYLELPIYVEDFLTINPSEAEHRVKECKYQSEFEDAILKFCNETKNWFLTLATRYEYSLICLALSDRCEAAYKQYEAEYSNILESFKPFKNTDELNNYKYRLLGGFHYNGMSSENVEKSYYSIKDSLIEKALNASVAPIKRIGEILGFVPELLSQNVIKEYVLKKERELFKYQKTFGRSYGIYFMLPEYVANIIFDYYRYLGPCYLSFLRKVFKGDRPFKKPIINERLKVADLKPNRTLLIFDYDGTVFNTDRLREARRSKSVSEKELAKIDYIEGFKELFLCTNSPLYLERYKVLGITSAYDSYYKALLNTHPDFSRILSYGTIRTSEKIKELKKFFQLHQNEFDVVIAFGDDEKDALIYSRLGIKFYIVNNYFGYDGKIEEILEKAVKNKAQDFRKNYLHDVKPLTYTSYKLKYFDDVVIYYKNYLDTFYEDYDGIVHGSKNAPVQGNVKPQIYDARTEMGKHSKNDYILNHLDELASLFDDLPLDKNSILVCVPGHAETIPDKQKPMYKLLECIARRHNVAMINDVILYRKKETEESKEGSRGIDKHLESLAITETGKKAIKGKTIYLFDDIATSGSSMMACSAILYHFNAGHIVCVCVARTCGDGKYAPVVIK